MRSTLSDWILPHSSSSSRILRKARATGAVVEFGLDERGTAIEKMILVGLRTEVGPKKTGQGTVSSVAGTWRIYHAMLLVLITARRNVFDYRSLHATI